MIWILRINEKKEHGFVFLFGLPIQRWRLPVRCYRWGWRQDLRSIQRTDRSRCRRTGSASQARRIGLDLAPSVKVGKRWNIFKIRGKVQLKITNSKMDHSAWVSYWGQISENKGNIFNQTSSEQQHTSSEARLHSDRLCRGKPPGIWYRGSGKRLLDNTARTGRQTTAWKETEREFWQNLKKWRIECEKEASRLSSQGTCIFDLILKTK